MKIQGNQFLSIEQLQEQYLKQGNTAKKTETTEGLSFQDILQKQAEQKIANHSGVKFSKHAANRLADREIELSDGQLERLSEGTRKASAKGINESLVIVDQLAFIVNIPNNTVITAMDQTETNENIYTNIDGAVIM